MLQCDSGMTVSSNRQTLGILLVWHLHSLHESVDQERQMIPVRQRGMETITASECSECNSRRIWNDNVGIEFTHFILLLQWRATGIAYYARRRFRLLSSESTSIWSESRFSPTVPDSGSHGGHDQALSLESSPPVRRTLF